jgi:DNA-directed RNA polymerase subunit N (RpoN/RPB10)
MLYPVCPTCGHLLADIELEFTEKYNNIVDSKSDEKKKENDIQKLFNDVKIKKYCCKMRLISYFDHIKVIQ